MLSRRSIHKLALGAAAMLMVMACGRAPRDEGVSLVVGANTRALSRAPRFVKLADDHLLEIATTKPRPAYPPRDVAAGVKGLAVAEFETNAEGKVVEVTVVEAPSQAIRESVRDAVQLWRFSPVTVANAPGASPIRGKLMFYFTITDGLGHVLSPAEAVDALR